jgi:tRNA and rRNA cytosine-C5-methylases
MKRKKNIVLNPLSDARKAENGALSITTYSHQRKKQRVKVPSKAELKAKELWHRKSGAGFHLFVEYYGGQPEGVVYTKRDQYVCSTKERYEIHSICEIKPKTGMSRAALRRKKKRDITYQNQRSEATHEIQQSEQKSKEIEQLINHSHIISAEFQEALRDKPNCVHITSFLSSMSANLPLTFRIRHQSFVTEKMKSLSKDITTQLQSKYSHLIRTVDYDATGNTIYQAIGGSQLTKHSLGSISPELKSLILHATSSGIMARQELGSMLPVIALVGVGKMQFGSKVLDMCASPGSKTLQALEVVASCCTPHATNSKLGRIVANDIHPLRLQALQDAIERSGVPESLTKRIKYTNHDASKFPTPKSGTKFDCIIADVPCSGDGTIRKDSHILPNWIPSIGNSLHDLQLSVLKRAIQLLNVGGVVAYSTCSLNPVEDEAVVGSALMWGNDVEKDSVELLDWPDKSLPGFKRRCGVTEWRIAHYDWNDEDSDSFDRDDLPRLTWVDSFDKAKDACMPNAVKSMWPSKTEDSKLMNLEKCTRLVPQDNDTGGFFVALIRKNKEIGQ